MSRTSVGFFYVYRGCCYEKITFSQNASRQAYSLWVTTGNGSVGLTVRSTAVGLLQYRPAAGWPLRVSLISAGWHCNVLCLSQRQCRPHWPTSLVSAVQSLYIRWASHVYYYSVAPYHHLVYNKCNQAVAPRRASTVCSKNTHILKTCLPQFQSVYLCWQFISVYLHE